MDFQHISIEISTVNFCLKTSPESETWQLRLSGKIAQPSTGAAQTIVFLNREINLTETHAMVFLEPLPKSIQSNRIGASEPWRSNEDCRNTLRIDGLEEGGWVYSKIVMYIDQTAIDVIRNVNLQTHQLIVGIDYMIGVPDPRPLTEPNTDHFFSYPFAGTIHILSHKEGGHQI